jgi:cytochrome b561
MQLANSKTRYGSGPQTLHWLTFLAVTCGWPLGWFQDYFPKGAPRAWALYAHMTLGQCVILFLVLRLVWRFANPPPRPIETRFGRLLEGLARLTHYALYVLLFAAPVLGIIVQLKRGNALPVFGLWDFQSPWPVDRAQARMLLKVHEYLATARVILAGVHAAAALTHHYVFGDRTLRRMLPGAVGRFSP